MNTAIIVSNTAPFGALMNTAIARLIDATSTIARVNSALNAAGGYQAGSPPGSALEITSLQAVTNNFGVVASSASGANGQAWGYAVNILAEAVAAFLAANAPQIALLDNGTSVS